MSTMKAQKDELDRGIEGLNQARNGVSTDKKSMQQGKSEMQAAQNEMASACLRNMLIAWVVLMPSSEKSFAASSLVCLSMRTVTLTASIGTSFRYGCLMRPLYVRQAGSPENPSWRDGYPLRGDRNTPRPASLRKKRAHKTVRNGCYLGCHARGMRVFLLFPLKILILHRR